MRNIFILFFITGLWHGASWTFVAWGMLNAFYFLPFILSRRIKRSRGVVAGESDLPCLREVAAVVFTFGLNVLAIIFFRAENLQHALSYLAGIFSPSIFTLPYYQGIGFAKGIIIIIICFMVIEWFGRRDRYAIEKFRMLKTRGARWVFYSFLILIIGVFMYSEETPFIYFQF